MDFVLILDAQISGIGGGENSTIVPPGDTDLFLEQPLVLSHVQ